jgi:hypothetical protein
MGPLWVGGDDDESVGLTKYCCLIQEIEDIPASHFKSAGQSLGSDTQYDVQNTVCL